HRTLHRCAPRAADACNSLKDNAKDICQKDAKAARVKTEAEAEANYKGTAKAHKKALMDIADANYAVAKEKCDDLKGNDKDVCVKEAKAAKTNAEADAKAGKKVSDARKDAREDKTDAAVSVQKEKCDALTGADKSRCTANANAGK
ncbi:MAG TPA: hypothetical protein VGO72_07750, partial [Herminiimonas sp.]|nr:hypothetical protein [Herminiimonas sp.]